MKENSVLTHFSSLNVIKLFEMRYTGAFET